MKLKAFIPRRMYKPLSITGSWCSLNCRFCSRKYLENMVHVNPANFTKVAYELYSSGVRGVLISGGFRQDATLPVEPYVEKICEVKRQLDLVVSMHLGLVRDRGILTGLKDCIDVVDYEFTLSSYIVNEIRGLRFSPEKYAEALSLMLEEGLHVVPHIFTWHPQIKNGDLAKELKVLKEFGVNEVTLLVFIDNEYVERREHLAEKVLKNIEYARAAFPGKLYMGCMRPAWIKPLLDPVLVKQDLVDRIANPYHSVLKEHRGIDILDACCSIPEHLTSRFELKLSITSSH